LKGLPLLVGKLREAEVRLSQGASVAEVVRALAISEVRYYRWRKQYGGVRVEQAKRLVEVERENARLRKAAFWMLAVVDEYTRERPAIVVNRKLDSTYMLETLGELFVNRGPPEHIRSVNGPEFCAKAVKNRLGRLQVKTLLILSRTDKARP